MKNILDRRFKYTPSNETDIRRRFEKIDPNWNKNPKEVERQRQKKEKKRTAPSASVTQIRSAR